MAHFWKRADFIVHWLLSFLLLQILFIVSFQRDHGFSFPVDDSSNDGKGSLANFESHLKFFEFKWLIIFAVLATLLNHLGKLIQTLLIFLINSLGWNDGRCTNRLRIFTCINYDRCCILLI